MKYPILYKSNETDFFAMGLGPIQMLKATVTQERNGIFIFEGEILTDSPLFPLVFENYIIKADADHLLKDQRFRIKRIVPNHNGKAEIYAEHVSYLSRELTIKPEVSITGSAEIALNQWKASIVESNPFIVSSDITTSASTKWRIDKVSNPMMALGGVEGSILDRWGGEYLFDNYHIRLLKKRGTTAQTVLAYGRNITDFEQERNILNTYTSVAPYAIYTDDNEKEIIVTIDGYVVDSEHVDKYPNRVTMPIDFSNEFGHDEIPTKARLTTLAQQYIADNEIGVPATSIKISFLDLSQTADYADYAFLEQVNLCDDVRVHYPKLGVNTIAKVVRVVWNCLTESYDEIEIGQKRMSLASQIQEQNKVIQEINTQVNQSQASADGKNIIFYGLYGENGLGEPNATKIGDSWFKPNGLETELYVWTGIEWKLIMSTSLFNEIKETIKDLDEELEQTTITANDAVNKAEQAIESAGFATDTAGVAATQSADAVAQAQNAVSESSQAYQLATQSATDANQALTTATDLLGRVNDVEGSLTTVQSDVDAVTGQLTHKVDVTTYNTLKGTVDTQTGLISANQQEILQRATKSEVNTLTGRVSTAEGQISTQAGQIAQRLTATQVESLVDGKGYATQASVNSQVSRIDGDLNSYSSQLQTVTATVDGITIGGRNLIIRSTGEKGKIIDTSGQVVTRSYHSTSDYILVKPNTDYMFTKSNSDLAYDARFFRWAWYDEDKNYISRSADSSNEFLWKTPNNAHYVRVSYPDDSYPQLEKGNQATDWTPAPEDLATVAELTTKTNAINQRITDTENSIQLVTQTTSTQGGQISSLRSDLNIETGRITSLITQTKDIVNLFKDPTFTTITHDGSDGSGWATNNSTGPGRVWTNTTGERNSFYFNSPSKSILLEAGKYYSIKVKVNSGASIWDLEIGTNSGENIVEKMDGTTKWITGTIKPLSNVALRFWIPNGQSFRIHELYVYETATGITTNSINSLKSTVDGTTQTIATIQTDLNGKVNTTAFTSFQQTVQGFQQTVNSSITGLESQQTQMAGQITSVVTDLSKKMDDIRMNSASTSSATNLYIPICTVTLSSTWSTASFGLYMNDREGNIRKMEAVIKVRQGGSMSSAPSVNVHVLNADGGFLPEYLVAVLISNTSERSQVSLYLKVPWQYSAISSQPYNLYTSGSSASVVWRSGVANVSSLPSGTQWTGVLRGNAAEIATAKSQITQLSDQIDLRVTKADLISQINVQAGKVLIRANDNVLMVTPTTTYIQDATIKTAHIADLAVSGAKIADASISSAKIISLDASKITANTLSAITTNTGSLNVSGWLIMSSPNIGLLGSYDFGDDDTGAFNPRYFVGDYRFSHRYLFFSSQVYNVSNGSKGTYKYHTESFYGPDYLKLRQYNSSAKTSLYNRIDITADKLQLTNDWGTTSGVILNADGTSKFGGFAEFSNGLHVGVTSQGVGVRTGRISAPENYNTLKINENRALADVTFSTENVNFNETRTVAADFRIGKDGSSINGGRVVASMAIYNRTYSSPSNMIVTPDGVLGRSTSALKYKDDVRTAADVINKAKKVLPLQPKSWLDKGELADGVANKRHYGFIADEFDALGLTEVVIYGDTGQVESLAYDRISMYHNVILSDHEQRLNSLANSRLEETLLLESKLLSLEETVVQLKQEIEQLKAA